MSLEKPRYINTGGNLLDLSVPKVMGILNITPDSFYPGSRFITDSELIKAAIEMSDEGADILDIGGYSSRPGAKDISAEEEGARVLRAIRLIRKELPASVISIDTFRSEIALEAVEGCGANMINDISGGEADNRMFDIAAQLNVPYVLMHMKGTPQTMQNSPVYEDVVAEILRWFGDKIFRLRSAGLKDIIIDPGFGFGKTTEHNFELLRRLGDFSVTGLPLMVGISRKGMIWKTLGISASEALNGTTALNAIALQNGADILRVHDVKEAIQTVQL
ncbi:MAG TPA: dihydropteroate synthase, partial [Bacteroidales bacterium]|nr:dihydropteroate synthase [Bacteroidales bacterium]